MSRPEGWWDDFFLGLARYAAQASKDPSTQVGAVIADGKNLVSVGFNGFPKGMADDPALYEDREIKYSRTIHGEVNAIFNSHIPVSGFTLYCTHPPCPSCALTIIQSGIKRVVYEINTRPEFMSRWSDAINKANGFFHEAGVEVEGRVY